MRYLLGLSVVLAALPLAATALETGSAGLEGPRASAEALNVKMNTQAAAFNAALNKFQTCNKKGKFYDPTHTDPAPDADGCWGYDLAGFMARTWHDVLSERGVNQTYRNTHDYPIEVMVTATASSNVCEVKLSIGGGMYIDSRPNAGSSLCSVYVTIPPNGRYSVALGTSGFNQWNELY
jgi:hypothetical protein